jgi:hypothetical protein
LSLLEFLNTNVTLVISFVGMLIAISSLAISASTYKRDQGRLDVKIGVWNVLNMETMQPTDESYIRITMVNSGRRPVVVDSLGGFPRFWRVRRRLHSCFPNTFDIVGFFLADQIVEKQLRDPRGEYQILSEGKKLTVSIPIARNRRAGTRTWDEVAAFYAGDSMGRCHYVPSQVLNKFKTDIKTFFQEA